MKFSTKKKDTEKIEYATQQSRNFEISLADVVRKSERRAWMVAWGAVSMSVLLAAGYMFLVPLKEKVPYLVMADPYTGSSTVAKLSGDFQNDAITKNEAINKSNVAHFVIARESYDWDLISRRDWNTVNSMAGTAVATEYRELFATTNPHSPDTLYGKKKTLRVKIKTIVLLGATKDHGPTGATVRFDRLLIDKQTSRVEATDSQIATLSFEYKANLNMQEEYRVENPLGFRVNSYRLDPESGSVSSVLLGDAENVTRAESRTQAAASASTPQAASTTPPGNAAAQTAPATTDQPAVASQAGRTAR